MGHQFPRLAARARRRVHQTASSIVRRLVKPERDRNKQSNDASSGGNYGERAPELYEAIEGLDHVLAISLVSNAVMPVRVATGQVFAHNVCGIRAR